MPGGFPSASYPNSRLPFRWNAAPLASSWSQVPTLTRPPSIAATTTASLSAAGEPRSLRQDGAPRVQERTFLQKNARSERLPNHHKSDGRPFSPQRPPSRNQTDLAANLRYLGRSSPAPRTTPQAAKCLCRHMSPCSCRLSLHSHSGRSRSMTTMTTMTASYRLSPHLRKSRPGINSPFAPFSANEHPQ